MYIRKGQEFNRLTAMEDITCCTFKRLAIKAKFKCECGTVGLFTVNSVKSGKTKSCGCYKLELFVKRSTTHGKSKHKLHKLWCDIKQRCFNKNSPSYEYYGDRGIIMCDEWKDDFQAFFDWCIANGWKPSLQIDREDNDDIYGPTNCRFITGKENCRNRRTTRIFELFGETKCLTAWSEDERCSVHYETVRLRIKKGWTIEKAITEPARHGKRNLNEINS